MTINNHRRTVVLLSLALPAWIWCLTSCAAQKSPEKAATAVAAPQPPFRPIATREEVMHGMVIPNADVVWKSTGTIITSKGMNEFQPKTEDDWIHVEASATTVMEAGNLLMMEGRAMDQAKWMERCVALVEAADGVRKAAKAHDKDALFTRGGDLFDACQACHFTYRYTTKDPNVYRTH